MNSIFCFALNKNKNNIMKIRKIATKIFNSFFVKSRENIKFFITFYNQYIKKIIFTFYAF